MPQKIRMWEVTPGDSPVEITSSGINLEQRLESWLESDISMLDDNLLVIGRQVHIPSVGTIDLLCLDSNGDLVVIELKKGQTPREVTAQALDYAAWMKDLSPSEVLERADNYFNERGTSLADAFQARFDGAELPQALNADHRSLIVAESMDGSTERIVRYLSDLGVPINVATVQHFTDNNGREMLAQVYLIEPEILDEKSKGRLHSRTTTLQLEAIAKEKGVGELYRRLNSGASSIGMRMGIPRNETRSFLVREGGSSLAAFVVDLDRSDSNQGLKFRLDVVTLVNYFGLDEEQLNNILPETKEDLPRSQWGGRKDEGWSGFQGFFRTVAEVDRFLAGLQQAAGQ